MKVWRTMIVPCHKFQESWSNHCESNSTLLNHHQNTHQTADFKISMFLAMKYLIFREKLHGCGVFFEVNDRKSLNYSTRCMESQKATTVNLESVDQQLQLQHVNDNVPIDIRPLNINWEIVSLNINFDFQFSIKAAVKFNDSPILTWLY